MKINNKGFAISSIMYIILILAVILFAVTLALLSSKNLILERIKDEAINDIYEISFAEDDWETIVSNIRLGKTSAYKVGDTKEISLTGFTNSENESGTYTVRIANKSTPSECKTEGFSQTACGFVIEFVDIITQYNINSSGSSVGGWKESEMRTYVNNDIYNSLPSSLKENIIDTNVVSGHEKSVTENYITTDKIYLLSTKEVWGKEGTTDNEVEYDTAEAKTRQLDYYKIKGVTTDNYLETIKNYNGSVYFWWLRSACSDSTSEFYQVEDYGDWNFDDVDTTYGVSVAFRIG